MLQVSGPYNPADSTMKSVILFMAWRGVPPFSGPGIGRGQQRLHSNQRAQERGRDAFAEQSGLTLCTKPPRR